MDKHDKALIEDILARTARDESDDLPEWLLRSQELSERASRAREADRATGLDVELFPVDHAAG